jgi:hypothetical protein
MRATWWPEGYTERGVYYASLGGGAAERPALPPGTAPGPVPSLYGGGFDKASRAGWLYHGGAVEGDVIDDGARTFLRLGSGAGTLARHNRLHLAADAASLELSYRIVTPDDGDGDDRLAVFLTARDGTTWNSPNELVLGPAASDWQDWTASLPAAAPRERAYTISFAVSGGAQVLAVVDLDDVEIRAGIPGDLDGDGDVDVDDLLALLGAWGACAGCPADIDGDGDVDVDDLLALLGSWGG